VVGSIFTGLQTLREYFKLLALGFGIKLLDTFGVITKKTLKGKVKDLRRRLFLNLYGIDIISPIQTLTGIINGGLSHQDFFLINFVPNETPQPITYSTLVELRCQLQVSLPGCQHSILMIGNSY
jgi:hypothetical protein